LSLRGLPPAGTKFNVRLGVCPYVDCPLQAPSSRWGGGQTPATLDPSAAGATPPPAQTGYGIPARRFITKAWASSRATPAIRMGSWAGLGIRPRETIRAVAPAGGWATRNTTIRQLVRPSDSAAAPTLDRSTPVAKAEGWP